MGSQYTGMCKDLATDYPYIAKFLQDCDDCVGYKLSDIMFNSDSNTLARIEHGSVAYHGYDKTRDIKIMSINNTKAINSIEDILPK